MTKIIVPDLGDGITEVEVAAWHVAEGVFVHQDDDLVELVTDKASFNIPSPVSGILKKVNIVVGGSAGIGSSLGEIV